MKQFTRYIFLGLIFILIYLLYLIISYKIEEYRVQNYIISIEENNLLLQQQIQEARIKIDIITSAAYQNKVLKSELGKKNLGEEVLTLISEDNYNKYSSEYTPDILPRVEVEFDTRHEESLIATMNIYEKWIYFLFEKDIR